MERSPLNLSLNVKLDHALGGGWESWGTVAGREGVDRVTAWLSHRLRNGGVPFDDLRELVETLLAPKTRARNREHAPAA